MFWQTTRFQIDLTRPRVMGIVNVTPDSFSDGGQHADTRSALAHCERLLEEGAEILDIGGESSRPGAQQLSVEEEWDRIEPVLREALKLGAPLSVDSFKPEIMRRALALGVDIINDIQAFRLPGALQALAGHESAGLCAMHMRGDSATMQNLTAYHDVTLEVKDFLAQSMLDLTAAGIRRERIVLDPGYGFAKTTAQNFELLSRQSELLDLGRPLLVGWSRKRSLGDVTGRPVLERLVSSVAAAVLALERGASIVRVHDVAATVDALKVFTACHQPQSLAAKPAQF